MNRKQFQAGGAGTLVIVGLLVLAVLGGVIYGPELMGYYRFSQAVETAAKESEANSGPWPQLNEVCMPCHGSNGNPLTQIYPRLAGQPAGYVAKQLTDFASGQRANPTMTPLATSFSADEINQLATYFAAQKVTPNTTFTPDPERLKKGEALVTTAKCAACHGAGLIGQAEFPRLAGQGHDYLVKQLNNFKSGARKDTNGVMAAVAATLSDDDIENMAHYLASH